MPRNVKKDLKQREERRRQILDAALELFSRRGLVAATMGDIAKLAGVSHAHLYNYFASKEEIFVHLLRTAFHNFSERINDARAYPGRAIDKLGYLSKFYVTNTDLVPYFMILLQARMAGMLPSSEAPRIIGQPIDLYERLASIMEEGHIDGSIVPGDSEEQALLFVSLLHGIILLPVKGYPQVSPSAVDTMLRMLRRD